MCAMIKESTMKKRLLPPLLLALTLTALGSAAWAGPPTV